MKAPNSKLQAPEKLQTPNIEIFNCQNAKKINLRLLKEIVATFLAELKIQNAELEINLVGAVEMTSLNKKFLRHEGSTDVITFDYTENMRLARTLAPPSLHGEIFVCVDEAILQAKKFGMNWQSEIVRYIVHGILHLLGYDDLRMTARKKMKREENRLLRKLSRRFALSKL